MMQNTGTFATSRGSCSSHAIDLNKRYCEHMRQQIGFPESPNLKRFHGGETPSGGGACDDPEQDLPLLEVQQRQRLHVESKQRPHASSNLILINAARILNDEAENNNNHCVITFQ